MSITNITYIKSLPSLILHDHSRLRCLASIKQTRTKLHFTPCGSLHATTPLCVVKERKKKKLLNKSRISVREEFSIRGCNYPHPCTKTRLLPLASNRWSSSTSLPQGLLIGIEREGEDGNEISTLWNSMGWFMTAISHQWRHAPHRLVEYYSPRDPLSLSFPPFRPYSRALLVSPFVRPFLWKRGRGQG